MHEIGKSYRTNLNEVTRLYEAINLFLEEIKTATAKLCEKMMLQLIIVWELSWSNEKFFQSQVDSDKIICRQLMFQNELVLVSIGQSSENM